MQPNNQNPDQPTPPEQPTQNQPVIDTSMKRTIQPLSSEDDIRSEAQSARSESPAHTSSNSPSSPISPSSATAGRDVNTSSLATEPLHQRAHTKLAPVIYIY